MRLPQPSLERLATELEAALKLELTYPERAASRRPVAPSAEGREREPAAVLLLFAEDQEGGEPALLYTKRSERVATHQGQMAFPGGKVEDGETLEAAALRETFEEVGIDPSWVRVVGPLPELVTVTGFVVTPFVGVLSRPVDQVTLQPSAQEIDAVVWAPLSLLEAPGTYRLESLAFGGARYPIHVFEVEGYRIWGATGSMTKNLLDRLQKVR